MAFPLIIVGLLMVITGARGTYAQFGTLIASEFQGSNNFLYWILALGSVGAVGYIPALRTPSRLLMTLILISLFLSHKGFFAQFQSALKTGAKPPTPVAPSGSAGTAAVTTPSGSGTFGGPTLKQSLQQPQGGGFWDYVGIPNSWRPSWAQQ